MPTAPDEGQIDGATPFVWPTAPHPPPTRSFFLFKDDILLMGVSVMGVPFNVVVVVEGGGEVIAPEAAVSVSIDLSSLDVCGD